MNKLVQLVLLVEFSEVDQKFWIFWSLNSRRVWSVCPVDSVHPVFRPTEFSSVFVQRLPSNFRKVGRIPSNFDFGLDKIPAEKFDNS